MPPEDTPTSDGRDDAAIPASDAPSSGTLEDEGIFCPICGYNLTGNLTGRCSECGGFFHRELLLETARVSAEAVMPWERPEEFALRERFWRTLRISCVHPREFALAFAAQPARSRSTSFYAICLGLLTVNAAAISGVGWLDTEVRGDERLLIILSLLIVVPVLPVTMAVGFVYALLYRHADQRRHLGPWRAILEYAVAHWFLMWLAPVLALLLAIINWERLLELVLVCSLACWAGCAVLWALTLKEVVRWRWPRARPLFVMVLTLVVAGSTWVVSGMWLAVLVEIFD